MNVFQEAKIGDELYYNWRPSLEHNKIYRKVIKISDTEYKELEGPEKDKIQQLNKFPIICTWSKDVSLGFPNKSVISCSIIAKLFVIVLTYQSIL